MTIVCCPQCRDQVTVPAGVSGQARVRCPLCREEYSLAAALERLPPALIVLGQSHEFDAESGLLLADNRAASVPAPATGFDGLPWHGEPPRVPSNADVEDWDLAPSSVAAFPLETAPVPAQAAKVVARRRAHRKPASPLRALVQVVGGGGLGLVIAQFILWWMPGNWPRENRDPLKLAEKVALHAPYLVPAQLRVAAADSSQRPPSPLGPPSPTNSSKLDEPNKRRPALIGGGMPEGVPGSEPPGSEPPGSEPSSAGQVHPSTPTEFSDLATPGPPNDSSPPDHLPRDNSPPGSFPPGNPATPAPTLTIDAPSAILDPDAAAIDRLAPTSMPAEVGLAAGGGLLAAKAPSVAIRRAPTLDAATIAERISAAQDAERAWDAGGNASREEKQQLFTNFYAALASLGEALVFAEPSPAGAGTAGAGTAKQAAEIATRASQLARQPEKLDLTGRFAGLWLQRERPNQGAVVVGSVVGHQWAGGVAEMRVKLAARSGPEIAVVTQRDQSLPYPVGTNLLILGVLVEGPRDKIEGYQGDALQVVVAGYVMHLPVSEQSPNP